MLRNYYITREWILSPAAQTVYRVSATVSLVLFFVLMPLHRRIDDMSQSLLPLVRLVVFTCVLGAAITMVAMNIFSSGSIPLPLSRNCFGSASCYSPRSGLLFTASWCIRGQMYFRNPETSGKEAFGKGGGQPSRQRAISNGAERFRGSIKD